MLLIKKKKEMKFFPKRKRDENESKTKIRRIIKSPRAKGENRVLFWNSCFLQMIFHFLKIEFYLNFVFLTLCSKGGNIP